MPRNISFALTTPQFRARTKWVTRRLGWLFLKPGDTLMGVEKGMGLKINGETVWPIILVSHSFLHAAGVFLVTGSGLLLVFEFVAHTITDYQKCKGRISFFCDQVIHVVCKILWILIYLNFILPSHQP